MSSASKRLVDAGWLVALCLLGLAGPQASAMPVLGPVVRVNQGFPGCSVAPKVAPLRSGGFAVAWNDEAPPETPVAKLRFADRLDGRPVNDCFWFFYGGLSDVRYDITVTDVQTGAQRTYHNRRGTLTSSADTGAFP